MSVVLSGVSVAQLVGLTDLVIALLLGSAILAGVSSRRGRGLPPAQSDLPIWWFDRLGRPVPVPVAKATGRAPPVVTLRDRFPDVPDPTFAYRRERLFPGDQS